MKLIEERMIEIFKDDWKMKVSSNQGTRLSQSNKLRTYRLFKAEYGAEHYNVESILSRNNRNARCGVAPLRIETGRFERLPVEDRFCFHC